MKICPKCNKEFDAHTVFCSGSCATSYSNARRWDKSLPALGWDGIRANVIAEQDNKCNKCNIDEWQGQPISLEVDHIDGDNKNHSRENLEGLCPNCHSQTKTWRGRNRGKPATVSDAQLIKALIENPNIRQALLSVGLAAKGNNYNRAKGLLGR